jgi:5'-nucleotidase (lipoprotein e(P4) family)
MLATRTLVLITAVSVLLSACVPRRQADADMDALLWSTASAEYEVIARQIFYQAQRQLDRQLDKKNESAVLEQLPPFEKLPPAIIVDVDDTLLSNGALHYRLMAEEKAFDNAAWVAWVNEARSRPIAGAAEYVEHASKKGVTVFYISNRDISLLEGTWRNLKQLGFPLEEGRQQLLLLNGSSDWGPDKSSRRAHVARQYRILQVVGDGLGDFIGGTASMSLEEQRHISSEYVDYWGDKWFMLPNPVYGDWEKAILEGGKLPSMDPMRAKYRFIRGGESQGTW